MTMQVGWSQQSKNWIVVKSGKDTTITYNFSKNDLMLLRAYVVKLEGTAELYEEDKKVIILKDSIIDILNKIIANKETMLMISDSTVNKLYEELNSSEAWGKEQERLKIKYEAKSKDWPKWLGVGTIIGFISCLLIK